MRWWGFESEQQSAAEHYHEAKEWCHSAFHAFCFELHTSASSAFQNKQQSLLLCLGAKILSREHLVCPRIQCTWSSLLKTSAWTFSFLVSQYASSARTAVWFGCDIGHPCLVSCHNMAQHAVSFLVIVHQKCHSTCNTLFFVLLCEHLGHPLCTHFLITQMTIDSVIQYSPWNLRKVQGQTRNCETSVVMHSFIDCMHQIINHQRCMPTSHLTVHALLSFIEHPNLFPNHVITQRIATIHLTDLVMNLTW